MRHDTGRVIDFFEPKWAEDVTERYEPLLKYHRETRNLMGYSYGLEHHWFPDHKSQTHVFDDYMHLEADAPGKRVLTDCKKPNLGSVNKMILIKPNIRLRYSTL
ncbi:hypothetical protein A9Q81_05225 [Gammaproteobacteria bacterium 42_54_T18]|nr:hypothetical protein A9Q81_05225 [Gammaproteobacteria bacterium 42_54_T18]